MAEFQVLWLGLAGLAAAFVVVSVVIGKTMFLSWFAFPRLVSRKRDKLEYWVMILSTSFVMIGFIIASLEH